MTTVRIRPAVPSDAPELATVMFRSVREGARRDYTAEQVEAWLPEPPTIDAVIGRLGDGRATLVAVTDDDTPIAYIDVQPDGHIDHLFCVPEHIGRGVAAQLYDELERIARARGNATLTVDASECARPLFERNGFVVLRRNELTRNDVALHNFSMEKWLD